MKKLYNSIWSKWLFVFTFFFLIGITNAVTTDALVQEEYQRRLQSWEELKSVLPEVESFTKWQESTGELPPDFQQGKIYHTVPDPFRFLKNPREGITKKDWKAYKEKIFPIYSWWMLGDAPYPPKEVILTQESTVTNYYRCTSKSGILSLGKGYGTQIAVEFITQQNGRSQSPVLLIPATQRVWASSAVSRGFNVCIYAERPLEMDLSDPTLTDEEIKDIKKASGQTFSEVWEKASWGQVHREAWIISRVVDWFYKLPNVSKLQIAVAGQGLQAKGAITAAVFDERISACIAISPGLGGFTPFRTFSEAQMGLGIEGITRAHPNWFPKRLRFFSGNESWMPFEQTDFVAGLAPRSLYVATLRNDPQESLWGNELALRVLQKVYVALGASAQRLYLRPIDDAVFSQNEWELTLDWLEYQWSFRSIYYPQLQYFPTYVQWRNFVGANEIPSPLTFIPKNYEDLLSFASGTPVVTAEHWNNKRNEILSNVLWGLGEQPPLMPVNPQFSPESMVSAMKMGRLSALATLLKGGITLGNGVHADFYFSEEFQNSGKKMPVVIWIPSFSVATGYTMPTYTDIPPYFNFAQEGFLTLTFDQIGTGTRIDEIRDFYVHYPRWSILGKMIQDISQAVDGIGLIPFADKKKIYLVGFDTGGMAALYAAALDPVIAGLVTIGGVVPMRLNSEDLELGGIARWTMEPPLLPRLCSFVGYEKNIPYDYNELMSLVAPRPQLTITFSLDTMNSYANMTKCMDSAARVYNLLGASSNFYANNCEDYKHVTPSLNASIIKWLKEISH